jgi:hypothetical protein
VTKVVGMLSPIGPFGLELVPKFPVAILQRRKAIQGSGSSTRGLETKQLDYARILDFIVSVDNSFCGLFHAN